MTELAILDLLFQSQERTSKSIYILVALTQKMQNQAQSRLAANARQRSHLLYSITE
jgi:hypothetical protein